LDAERDPTGAADPLRRKCSRDLKKAHLLVLCHHWGYKSDLWVQKGSYAKTKRARTACSAHGAVAAEQQQQQQQLVQMQSLSCALAPGNRRLPALIDGQSVADFVTTHVAAPPRRSAALFSGPAAQEMATTRREGFFQLASLQEYALMASFCARLSTAWEVAGRSHRVWSANVMSAAQRSAADTSCAWQVMPLATCPEPLDGVLQQLDKMLSTAERARLVSEADQNVSHTATVVMREFKDAIHAGIAFLQSTRLLLAQLRATVSFAEYAAAGELVLDLSKCYAAATAEAYTHRHEWSTAAIKDGIQLTSMREQVADQYLAEWKTMVAMAASAVH
jgi:hypothetical protein